MPATTNPATVWVIELYLFDGSAVRTVNVTNPLQNSTVLENLASGTMYMVRVAGINTRGIGNFSSFSTGLTHRGKNKDLY